jgi:hypothetical protein
MKKLFFAVMFLGIAGVCYGAPNQAYLPQGGYYETNTAVNSIVTVSSTSFSTSTAVMNGVVRIFQNTGTGNLYFSFTGTGINTSGVSYLSVGQFYIEDKYFGDIYFLSAPTYSNTLSINAVTYK